MYHAPDFTWTEKIWAGIIRWIPSKYGLLYRSISDITLPCTYFTLPYCSKLGSGESQYYVTVTDEYTRYLLYNLADYTEFREKNISNDRQFKSIRVESYLLEKRITIELSVIIRQVWQRKKKSWITEKICWLHMLWIKRGKLNILVSGTMHDEVGKSRNQWEEPSTICFYHEKRCVCCRTYGNVKVNHKVQLKALGNECV